MSTSYYALKKPITSIRPEVMGGHTHVGIWVNRAKSGTLVFRNDEWRDAIYIFVDDVAVMRTHWGGKDEGCVLQEMDTSLSAEQQVVSGCGELISVEHLRNKAKKGN